MRRLLPLLLLAAVACSAARPVRLEAAAPAKTPGERLSLGFAHAVQVARDALNSQDGAGARSALDAAARLSRVLDHAAPIPRPVQRRDWIDAIRAALTREGPPAALALLGGADERTLASWIAPLGSATNGAARGYIGASLIDATGARIGTLAAESGERAELLVGAERLSVPLGSLVFGPPGGPVAAPELNPRSLRVCADPQSLPLENALAELLARELGAELHYVFWPARRGFLRHTLLAHRCELVMGMPRGAEQVLTTEPVYRSTYVLVGTRASSLDDEALRTSRIGVPLVGDDGANPPPVAALVERGLTQNLRGYPVYGPPDALIRAISNREVDVAVAWGPPAGYYAARADIPLTPLRDPAFAFEISLAVRKDDRPLRAELDRVLRSRRAEIDALLARFHVPRS
ncbi:MAG TPA: transporter substrate-binding domain-containing protein [Polyangiales bacterium]|nr:transporter substrate-binding domain-containing protein [Polyangiales bacterium]